MEHSQFLKTATSMIVLRIKEKVSAHHLTAYWVLSLGSMSPCKTSDCTVVESTFMRCS